MSYQITLGFTSWSVSTSVLAARKVDVDLRVIVVLLAIVVVVIVIGIAIVLQVVVTVENGGRNEELGFVVVVVGSTRRTSSRLGFAMMVAEDCGANLRIMSEIMWGLGVVNAGKSNNFGDDGVVATASL